MRRSIFSLLAVITLSACTLISSACAVGGGDVAQNNCVPEGLLSEPPQPADPLSAK